MQVAIDARELSQPVHTGIGSYLHNLLNYIQGYYRGPLSFTLLSYTRKGLEKYCDAGFRCAVIPYTNTFLWDNVRLRHFLEEGGYRLFYSPYMKMPLFLSIPAVVTVHDYPLWFWLKSLNIRQIMSTYFRAFYSAHYAKKIITVSKSSKRDIIRFLGAPPEKIRVVYEGVDRLFQPMPTTKKTIRKHYNVPLSAFVLLYVGNALPHKNIPTLLKAFSALCQKDKDVYLVLVLSHANHKFIKIIEKQFPKRIIVLQNLPSEELVKVYNMADVFVFLSKYEGFGLPPLEAMSCGLPTILTRCASLPEVGGSAAIYVAPKDWQEVLNAVLKLKNDAQLYQKYQQASIENSKRFSIEKMGRDIVTVLEEVAGV